MSDFNGEDYDFAAGTIKGIRSWKMDDLGRLTGVTYKTVWTPGENVSACANGGGRYERCPGVRREGFMFYGQMCDDPTCTPRGHLVANMEGHHFDPECGCGFWAYDEDRLVEHGDVTGVIEGYGKTTLGAKGFRCEKARIVALCREREKDYLSLSAWMRLKVLYPDAGFYDEQDDMILAHGEVLRTWEPVGEDFWTRKVAQGDDDTTWPTLHRYLSAAYPPVPTRRFASGGFLP